MKINRNLFISLTLLLLAVLSANAPGILKSTSLQGRKVQYMFDRKIGKTHEYLKNLPLTNFQQAIVSIKDIGSRGISLLLYENDKLKFWSDKDVAYSRVDFDTVQSETVIRLENSYYYVILEHAGEFQLAGLIKLSNNYPYENRFLNNGINSDFSRFPATIRLSSDEVWGYPIYNDKEKHVFSVEFDTTDETTNTFFGLIATIFLLLGIIVFFIFIRLYLNRGIKKRGPYLAGIVGALLLVRWLLTVTGILNDKYFFFDPFIYATGFAPTFGDLILNTFLFLFLAYLLFKFVRIPKQAFSNISNQNAWIGILNIVLLLVLLYVQKTSISIITDSSISVVVDNISQISSATILVYIVFATNYFAYFLLILWVFRNFENISLYRFFIHFGTLLLVYYVSSFPLKITADLYTLSFVFILYVIVGLAKEKFQGKAIFSLLVLILSVFSIYVLLFTFHYSTKKEEALKRSFAGDLANEHDQVAEYLFESLSEKLPKDTTVSTYLLSDEFDGKDVHRYLTENYFDGYLKKYNLIITICGPRDSVLFKVPEDQWFHCYEYFQDYIDNYGIKVPGASFYYLENYTGLISYIGWVRFADPVTREVSLFLELDSKLSLTSQPLGYPELLLDKRVREKEYFDPFSYAKYHKGNLISQNGDYSYSLSSFVFRKNGMEKYYTIKYNGYTHLVYKADNGNLIVISEVARRPIDIIVTFSYVFVFYYLLALVFILFMVSRYRHLSLKGSLRNRIQFSIILILITSLLLIAGSTTWFNIRKYNQTQFRIIKEKIQSVYVELEHKLAFENELTPGWHSEKYDNLDLLLIKFSDVFYSDINLYSPEGNLLATSRPEIFQIGLQNRKMEPLAYYKMHTEKLAKYVHKEKINKLSYLSAYVPFVNRDGKLLAYLNLPYFTKQKELQEDITTLTVAIINIYVLLILLTILMTVFISNQITKPLEMLQAKFRNLTLRGKHEQINYTRDDEIGKLVEEYNKMAMELEKNIELLAKSERESAWREMAKQVAHEIKNPLTPMRLSVQQLQRAWNDKKENFESYLLRVTQTLIEQIDNLSKIASEFSNFAKMPLAQIERVDVYSILEKTVKLFRGNEKVHLELHAEKKELYVKADPEQLNRVFINIIKNGIQAIPESKKGQIKVSLKMEDGNALVEIEDNGKGIPEEIKGKLFQPNFTTKTSGMGLGLAIVQNILEQMGGNISFKTKLGEGTLFIIRIPLTGS